MKQKKTPKALITLCEQHWSQSQAIIMSDMSRDLKVKLLQNINALTESVLRDHNCYHGYDMTTKAKEMLNLLDSFADNSVAKVINYNTLSKTPEYHFHRYLVSEGQQGDSHRQLGMTL